MERDISGINPQDIVDGVVNFVLDVVGQISEMAGGGGDGDGSSILDSVPGVGK